MEDCKLSHRKTVRADMLSLGHGGEPRAQGWVPHCDGYPLMPTGLIILEGLGFQSLLLVVNLVVTCFCHYCCFKVSFSVGLEKTV